MSDKRILIDHKTRDTLKAILNFQKELSVRFQLVLQTYINAKGLEGEYQLSDDCSELILKEEVKDDSGSPLSKEG